MHQHDRTTSCRVRSRIRKPGRVGHTRSRRARRSSDRAAGERMRIERRQDRQSRMIHRFRHNVAASSRCASARTSPGQATRPADTRPGGYSGGLSFLPAGWPAPVRGPQVRGWRASRRGFAGSPTGANLPRIRLPRVAMMFPAQLSLSAGGRRPVAAGPGLRHRSRRRVRHPPARLSLIRDKGGYQFSQPFRKKRTARRPPCVPAALLPESPGEAISSTRKSTAS